jgi:hypothetical protein
MSKPSEPMIRCNFFLPPQVVAELKKRAGAVGTPVSEHVRRALLEYLKMEPK